MNEYEVEALLYHAFRIQGAERLGFGSIVASGPNAVVLHYTANDRKMTDRDLCLIDAGAEVDYYTADVTRVFPVGSVFSKEQREIYSAVLEVQKSCIVMARPGKTMKEIHEQAVEVLVEQLRKLKILKGSSREIIKKEDYKKFYPHRTGHWLGMDVHDVGRYYGKTMEIPRKLEPGMVLTVEPGLYFPLEPSTPGKYRGIGVRIEDDILVTPRGPRVLTSGVPREVDEIEALRNPL
jgi:Xaa-Pro aminopeptidase